MVKFVMVYLDVIKLVLKISNLLIVVYNVSGEYFMVKVVVKNNWIDE